MFDRSYLPPADLEFVVMTDTHFMLDPGDGHVEFESRRRQPARAAHALRLVASLDTSFVVHLGDLIQEFPESPGFVESLNLALQQFAKAGVSPHQVPGNHDVGDKPDPTMPTDWVTEETLRAYHERFGRSWYGWDEGGWHFVVLNSQIMNGPLPAVAEQQQWLEADLATNGDRPTAIFMHLSPFLVSEHEQALGHYDNIDEPGRSWLLELVRRHNVKLLFSGHTHFSFFNRVGDARSRVVPSTAFTRPGFCQVFSSPPPPERGRDDAAKLGFLLVRIMDDVPHVHLIRTNGEMEAGTPLGSKSRIITRTPLELPGSPLGLTLRHTLAPSTHVPIAWQSTIRQPVRNDYPLLACIELGAKQVRVPAGDLMLVDQRDRLRVLRDEGIAITATWIWSGGALLPAVDPAWAGLVDHVEIQVPNDLEPDPECLRAIRDCGEQLSAPISLAPLLPKEVVPGKQHARTRIGYHLGELPAVNDHLVANGIVIDRVLCRVDSNQDPWHVMSQQREMAPLTNIGAIDWAVEFADSDEQAQIARAAAALLGAATLTNSRLFLEPLVTLDRTMDAPLGLLDRLCNPKSVFNVVRILNTVLFSGDESWKVFEVPGESHIGLQGRSRTLVLLLPHRSGERFALEALSDIDPGNKARLIRLVAGTSEAVVLAEVGDVEVTEASLIQLG